MNSKRMIWLVYECDAWKSTDSMRLVMATTSIRRLKSFIAQKIKRGEFYYGSDDIAGNKEVAAFKEDFEHMTSSDINGNLIYGYYEYTHDGEEM